MLLYVAVGSSCSHSAGSCKTSWTRTCSETASVIWHIYILSMCTANILRLLDLCWLFFLYIAKFVTCWNNNHYEGVLYSELYVQYDILSVHCKYFNSVTLAKEVTFCASFCGLWARWKSYHCWKYLNFKRIIWLLLTRKIKVSVIEIIIKCAKILWLLEYHCKHMLSSAFFPLFEGFLLLLLIVKL